MQLPDLSKSTEKLKRSNLQQVKKSITYAELTTYIRPYAEGNIYTGEQAYHTGFVDALGNLDTAVKLAAKLSGIQGKPNIIHVRPKEPSFFEKMLGEASEAISPLKKNGVSMQYIMR